MDRLRLVAPRVIDNHWVLVASSFQDFCLGRVRVEVLDSCANCASTVAVMEPLALLHSTAAEYRTRLVTVPEDCWGDASACDDWTVRDVADHIVGGNRFAVALLDGASTEQAMAAARVGSFDGDPIDQFDETAAAQLAAFEAPGALERIVHHPAGDMPGAAFVGFRAGDLLLHGWDLARSTGGDETLPAELAAAIHAVYLPTAERAKAFGVFADTGTEVTDETPIARRLLILTGRA
jgi:uncharacterized protein (TIGR03086 family)